MTDALYGWGTFWCLVVVLGVLALVSLIPMAKPRPHVPHYKCQSANALQADTPIFTPSVTTADSLMKLGYRCVINSVEAF